MSTEIMPNSRETEKKEFLPFEAYRKLCDTVDDFRKVGIQDSVTYEAAVSDENSIMIETHFGTVPLLASIDTEKMYCAPRCSRLLDERGVKLLAVPIDIIRECVADGERVTLPNNIAVIIEEFENTSGSQFENLRDIVTNDDIEKVEFVNEDLIPFDNHSTAWMSAYTVVPGSDMGNKKFSNDIEFSNEIVASWKQMRQNDNLEREPNEQSTGVFYFSNEELQKRPDIIEGLWAVSSFGFGEKLGKGHPLSMEFNREYFDQQITSRATMTAMYIEEGEPLCFSFISPNFNENDWLNCESGTMKEFFQEAEDNGRVPLHWFELISKGERGMGYADKVLQEFMTLAARSGYDFQVFFESTNLSSLYIPDIVREQVQKTQGLSLRKDVTPIGKLNYYALLT